ncbi:MAG: class I SAM-dependent methyltransferase [Candidatus Methanomethylophilus sp.]|nr:class I SAM-dependent methyltransferase [Methanomethylophilus sp.]
MFSAKTEEFLENRVNNPEQQAYFDKRAAVWDQISVHDQRKVEHIADLLAVRPDDRVLDVGTGTGVMIPHYLSRLGRDGHVTALDYSPKMLAAAAAKYPPSPQLDYVTQDLYTLTAGPRYDLVVCYSCFPHFPDPLKAIQVLAGTLVPGGRLWIAHSTSKEHINCVHRDGGAEINRDFLPDMTVMKELFHSVGLIVQQAEDDAEYYLIGGILTHCPVQQ